MCGISWQHDAEHDMVRVYPSVEALKEEQRCWESGCGIVKIKAVLVEWAEPQDMRKMITTALPAGEMNNRLIAEVEKELADKQAFLEKLKKGN